MILRVHPSRMDAFLYFTTFFQQFTTSFVIKKVFYYDMYYKMKGGDTDEMAYALNGKGFMCLWKDCVAIRPLMNITESRYINNMKWYLKMMRNEVFASRRLVFRCISLQVLSVILLIIMTGLSWHNSFETLTGDRCIFLAINQDADSELLFDKLLTLKKVFPFSAQAYCYVDQGAGIYILGSSDESAVQEREQSRTPLCTLSNPLIPREYDIHTDDIKVRINDTTFQCIGKHSPYSLALISTVPASAADKIVLYIDKNPNLIRYNDLNQFINKDYRKLYE